MKKAYVLTFFFGTNYGSKLQATATCKWLEKQGYEVSFIKTFLDPVHLLKHPSLIYTRIQNYIHRSECESFFNSDPYDISEKRQRRIDRYNKDNLPFITIKSHKQWKEILRDNPVFISGSDIIWQPANGYPEKYFLDFAYYTKCKRISYSSSVGSPSLPIKYKKFYKKYLGSYDAISVRENATRDLFKGIIDNTITKVIDPTLLVSREIWDELSAKAEIKNDIIPNQYILCYFVMKDDRYWKYVELASKETGLKIVVLPMHKQDEESGYNIIDDGTPYEFIWLIRNAAFIITDSFHASVFSFLYEKELYILKRARGDEDEKFNDLTKRYGLENRIVLEESVFNRNEYISDDINKERLIADRKNSEEYLINALS